MDLTQLNLKKIQAYSEFLNSWGIRFSTQEIDILEESVYRSIENVYKKRKTANLKISEIEIAKSLTEELISIEKYLDISNLDKIFPVKEFSRSIMDLINS